MNLEAVISTVKHRGWVLGRMRKLPDPRDIVIHRTSEDERLGCPITEMKRKVFRFHETILSFGEPGSSKLVQQKPA